MLVEDVQEQFSEEKKIVKKNELATLQDTDKKWQSMNGINKLSIDVWFVYKISSWNMIFT